MTRVFHPIPSAFRAKTARVVYVACLMGGLVLPAHAQAPARDPVAAEALFNEAQKALEAGQWEVACEKFQKSMDLDAAPSTLARIAQCREREGKVATAWYEYQRALKVLPDMNYSARRRQELERHIRKLVAALEPRVPKLRITVTPAPPGLEVLRDGSPLPVSALGQELAVDPGEHVITAHVSGYLEARMNVSIAEGKVVAADLTLVASGVVSSPLSRAPPPPPVTPANPRPSRRPHPSLTPTEAPAGWGQRQTALVVGGAGVALLGTALYFALKTLSLVGESNDFCGEDGTCEQHGLDLRDNARKAQTWGFVCAGTGAALLGVGIALFASAPHSATRSGQGYAVHIDFALSPMGAVAGGTW